MTAPRVFLILLMLVLGGCFMPEPEGLALQCVPPQVVETTPAPGETDVPLDEDITVTFSTPMDSASFDSSSLIVVLGTDTVEGEIFYDPSDTTLIFDPTDSLLPEETYTVILVPEFLDTLGFPIDTTYTWTFTTVDSIEPPPEGIEEVFPRMGDKDVPLDEEILVSFDEPIDTGWFDDTTLIVLTLGPDTVDGTLTYHPEDSTMVFDPVDSLIPDTTYTVTLTIPSDEPPGPMGPPPPDTTIVWTFETVDSIPNPPKLEAVNNGASHSKSGQSYQFLNLFWYPAPGPVATTYRIQVSTSPLFATTVFDAPGIPNNSFIVYKAVPHGVMPTGQQYFWRVNASNSGGTSGWSTVWNFTVNP
jgi:hypothetical protein